MPIYEYACKDCSELFEVLHRTINDKVTIRCTRCASGNVTKLMSRFAGKTGSTSCSSCSSCSAAKCNSACGR